MTLLAAQTHCTLFSDEESRVESTWSAELSMLRKSRTAGTCKSPFWLGLKYLQNSYLSSAGKSFRKTDNGTFATRTFPRSLKHLGTNCFESPFRHKVQ